MIKKTISGFTLIELLMVISIITLLSSMFLGYVGSASAKSRDSVRLSDMKQINTAATMYYDDNGVAPDSIETLVSTGYLSTIPVDPKTKESYAYKTGFVNGKKVFTVKAKYEKIYTTNTSNEEVPQQVGMIVGDIDLSQICTIVLEYQDIFGTSTEAFPTCDSSNASNDQIIGYSSGHRSGGSKTIVDEEISNCSTSDVNKKCPSERLQYNCYCGGTLNNINSELLSQVECKNEYNLFWDSQMNRCFDQLSCESALRVWNNGTCNPAEVSYSNCSIEEVDKACIPLEDFYTDPRFVNCYCDGVLNNINPDTLSQSECVAEYKLYFDNEISKCFNRSTCLAAGRSWYPNICYPLPLIEYSDCSYSQINQTCYSHIDEPGDPCYCDGELKRGYIPPSSVWEPTACQNLGGVFSYPDSCVFSNVNASDCVSVGGTVVSGTNYQCSIYTTNPIDGN